MAELIGFWAVRMGTRTWSKRNKYRCRNATSQGEDQGWGMRAGTRGEKASREDVGKSRVGE